MTVKNFEFDLSYQAKIEERKSMKNLSIIYLLLLFAGCSISEKEKEYNSEIVFDSLKAFLYGADDYGMKTYVFAFLKKGPNRDMDSAKKAELQKAHLKNIAKMADDGRLVLAGPFFGDGEIRGIYIFDVSTIEEARSLTESDPAIKAGSLEMELVRWYGTAALVEVSEISKSLAKKSFAFD